MKTVLLEDLCHIQIGKTPSRKISEYWNGELPWVTISDFVQGRIITKTKEAITQLGAQKSGSKLIPEGTLLLSFKLSLGKRAFAGCDLFTNEAIAALQALDEEIINKNYLYWALGSLDYDRLVDRAAKGKTLNKAKLKKLQIPLPPLDEQKRIAGILDAADALRAKRRESIALLDTLLQSTFLDMFGDPVTNPMGWDELAIADLCDSPDDVRCGPFGTQLQQHEFTDSGIPLWGIKHVNAGFSFLTDEFVTQEKAEKLTNYSIIPGDLVMTRKGTIGNCHIYPSHLEPGIMHSDLLRLRVSPDKANAQFISSQFAYSRRIQRQLELMSPGAVMPGINVTKLKKLLVETPPLDLQQQFATIVECVEQQKARQYSHLIGLDDLSASLQSRAFRGEL